jgi:hypothetical protein
VSPPILELKYSLCKSKIFLHISIYLKYYPHIYTLPKAKNRGTIDHRHANCVPWSPGVLCVLSWSSVGKFFSLGFANSLAICSAAASSLRNNGCYKSLTLLSKTFKKGTCRKLGGRYVLGGSDWHCTDRKAINRNNYTYAWAKRAEIC